MLRLSVFLGLYFLSGLFFCERSESVVVNFQSKPNVSEISPVVGAIRWDAWTGGEVTRAVEKTLGPEKYHFRLPWFAKVTGKDSVQIDGSSPSIMDQEIDYAEQAGLDYWAFVLYPDSSPLSVALKNYLKSGSRKKINFSIILMNSQLFAKDEANWIKERDRAIALLKEPGYQTVLNNRPLVFVFELSENYVRFDDFRNSATKAGLNPYYVYMGWSPAYDFDQQSPKGFDAVSAYAYAYKNSTSNVSKIPFLNLVKLVEDWWMDAKSSASSQIKYVPFVTTGWDPSPRRDNPVPWITPLDPKSIFPQTASPDEIADHLQKALGFVRENSNLCQANAVIIYAWNEFDEGGWLAPTWTSSGIPETDRIQALGRVLKSSRWIYP
jgi:hypothetical protein